MPVIEASILKLLTDFPATTSSVRVPHFYLFDEKTSTQVLQDIPGVVDLKTILASPTANAVLSRSLTTFIGYALGSWLRSFHSWTPAQSKASAIEIGHNEPMRKLKYLITYGAFIDNLEQFPDVLEGHREDYDGQVTSPSILISETQPPTQEPKLFAVDWEFVQFGHRAYDIGQMIGDLYERKHFNDAEAALWIIDAFIKGYGTVMKMGMDMVLRGSARDKK
ncbi:hypothetical protein Hte_002124 [Hypoxylon texense]